MSRFVQSVTCIGLWKWYGIYKITFAVHSFKYNKPVIHFIKSSLYGNGLQMVTWEKKNPV